ncbi:PilZ domain-containing protein [Bradyrhizobium sp. 76]|nr:PilZ domain-containing protein [Bradyrhizobium sp. 76]MCK1406782.1 PilZ domain-containing protein [Bradyrhizobium sp. 76]
MNERRRVERSAVSEAAHICGDGSSIRCCVIDISVHGAAIELPNASFLRDRFKLSLEKDRVIRKCRLVWKSGSRIGVEFTD